MKKEFSWPFLIPLISVLFFTSLSFAKIPEIILEQKKAVVTVYIYDGDKEIASGSGCIIDGKGILATNYHVIASTLSVSNASVAFKMANGEFIKAEKIIAASKEYDIVLIQLKGNNFPSLRLTKKYTHKQGDDVVVIGSPFGLETTVSNGIISSIRGEDEFIQITAPISPGSSGSPVFNSEGEVIGIATLLIEGGQNLNFAIPVKYITTLLDNPKISEVEKPKEEIPGPQEAPVPAPTPRAEDPGPAPVPWDATILDKQIEEYTIAIALTPNDASLYSKRGEAYMNKFEYQQAVKDLTQAISLAPTNGFYYHQRHMAYYFLHKYELALHDISKAIELKKSSPALDIYKQLFSDRGLIYIDMGQYDKAFEDYKKATKIDPKHWLSYPSSLRVSRDRFSDCFKFFNKMISLRPKDADVYAARSDFYEELKQYDKAIIDVTKAIELDPNNYWFSYGRGLLYFNMGDLQKAKADFQKLCDMDKASSLYRFSKKDVVEKACKFLNRIGEDEARGIKWKRISSSETASYYYDTTSIKPFKKHLRVWLRTEENVNSYIEERKKNRLPIEGYEDYSHNLDLLEFDCSSDEIGQVASITYTKKGQILNKYESKTIDMSSIIPDSIGDALFKLVCKK